EYVGAIAFRKALSLEEREAVRLTKYEGKNRKAALRGGSLQVQFTPIVSILTAIGTAIIVGVGTYVAACNNFSLWFLTIPAATLTVGSLTVFLAYLSQFYQPLRNFSKLANLWNSASSGAERIQEVLDAAPEVTERESAA